MIAVTTLIERMESLLDAEGSDRYLFDNDYRPAINSSIDWLVAVFDAAFSDNKLPEENLRELSKTKIFQTNAFSRVSLNPVTISDKIWTILNVIPEPEVFPIGSTVNTVSSPEISMYRPDLTFLKSDYSAKRLSSEEWHINKKNIFVQGNNRVTKSFKDYAYLNDINNTSTSYSNGTEIEIRPDIPNSFVAINYIKIPTPVNLITDNVELPLTLTNLVVSKALNFIAYKQGDGTNLYSVTDKDTSLLVKIMN